MVLSGVGIMIILWSALAAGSQDEPLNGLSAGEIMVSTQAVPGTSLKRAEVTGVIDAPPEIVWRVITDINNFKYFMPRTANSMAVAAEKLPVILQIKPSQAEEVEHLLGPTPPDPASYRLPGGKYVVYHYSNLDFPWPPL
jgi:hypothetical protein